MLGWKHLQYLAHILLEKITSVTQNTLQYYHYYYYLLILLLL